MSAVRLVSAPEDAMERIVAIARVSSPRTDKTASPERLVRYLIKHKHWSPFEHAYVTVEIITSRAISAQLCRHRSFTFQEFSQRYADVTTNPTLSECVTQPIEIRYQDVKNRQSSMDLNNYIQHRAPLDNGVSIINKHKLLTNAVDACVMQSIQCYRMLIDLGVAKESARFVLPMAVSTTIYMTGSLRSWLHFFDTRCCSEAQREIRDVADSIKAIVCKKYPLLFV